MRREQIKELYKNIYEEELDVNQNIEDVEEDILHYYNAAGFDFETIDEILKQIEKEKNLF